MKNRRGLILVAPIILVTLAIMALPSIGAAGEWHADITTSPYDAYQGVNFEYQVRVQNTGNATLHVTRVTLDILWGHDWMFPDSSPPHEFYEVYKGDRAIGVGEEYTFKTKVKTGFFGMFPTNTEVTAYQEGDAVTTVQNISGSMSFTSAPPLQSNPISSGICFSLIFVMFIGISIFGFYWGKMYWSHEIDNALHTKDPDGLLWWKWHAYLWEKEGQMWKNYVLWVLLAIFFTLLIWLQIR